MDKGDNDPEDNRQHNRRRRKNKDGESNFTVLYALPISAYRAHS
jgi:hypothetical protein